ncbi:hypothetical protein CLV80_102394 [Yoonia maritima]|uniref:Uncharacterized protein n=1 Tax=Yoonia maritima TaxID=1435347 RepID=A0A2T0W3K9_9RHOB|nr:hypothetical protein [Yoonia maritima]PRY79748.1 hypothetical protein CLV80_102394 [Yoonia maritima]
MIDIILIALLFAAMFYGSPQGGTHPFIALVRKCRAKAVSVAVKGVNV